MGRNYADAQCPVCRQPFRWLIGEPQVCRECLTPEDPPIPKAPKSYATYRIYTEDKRQELIEQLASRRFAGFTVFNADGFWLGRYEPSLVIEIITDLQEEVYSLAREIKELNEQEAVLVTESVIRLVDV